MKQIILQIVIITLVSVIITLMRRILHRWWPRFFRYSTVWPFLMGYYSSINLTWRWFSYPMMLWALIGILIVIGQILVSGELIYHRFWRFFWKITVFYATIVYIASIFYTFMG